MAYSVKKIKSITKQYNGLLIVNKMKQENSPPAQMRPSALCLHSELLTSLCLQFHVIPCKQGCAAPGTEGSTGRLWNSSTSPVWHLANTCTALERQEELECKGGFLG